MTSIWSATTTPSHRMHLVDYALGDAESRAIAPPSATIATFTSTDGIEVAAPSRLSRAFRMIPKTKAG